MDNEGASFSEETIDELAYINGRCIETSTINEEIKTKIKKMCEFEFNELMNNHQFITYFEDYRDKIKQYYSYMALHTKNIESSDNYLMRTLTKCNDVFQLKKILAFNASIIEMKFEQNRPIALAILEKKRSKDERGLSRMIQYEVFS